MRRLGAVVSGMALVGLMVFVGPQEARADSVPTPAQESAAGTAWAWGSNDHGQLGDGTTDNRLTPVQVVGLSGVTAIAGGLYHSLGVRADGTAWAWGNNSYGQLGDGTATERYTAVQVRVSGVTAIAGGLYHSLGVRADGTAWAWGYNGEGQLGDGTTDNRLTPVQVGLSGVTAIAGGTRHSLAARADGTAWAWGNNSNGQLGDGTYTDSPTPVQVVGLSGVTAAAAGDSHSLALRSDGTVWAWGRNGSGQLGDGTYTDSSTPVQVVGLSGVTAIAVGDVHSLAARADGTAWAWGYNGQGQLGDGTYTDSSTPVRVVGVSGVTAIAAHGEAHSLALRGQPQVSLSATSLSFGSVAVGSQSSPVTLKVTNSGTATLSVGALSVEGANPGDYRTSADACSGTAVSPGGSCVIEVRFAPQAAGSSTAALSIPSNAPASPHIVALSGLGDGEAPVSTFTTMVPVLVRGLHVLAGTTTDDVSGVGNVRVDYTPLVAGPSFWAAATLGCDEPRLSCDWTAPPPPSPNLYVATARGTDRAGNVEGPGSSITILVL